MLGNLLQAFTWSGFFFWCKLNGILTYWKELNFGKAHIQSLMPCRANSSKLLHGQDFFGKLNVILTYWKELNFGKTHIQSLLPCRANFFNLLHGQDFFIFLLNGILTYWKDLKFATHLSLRYTGHGHLWIKISFEESPISWRKVIYLYDSELISLLDDDPETQWCLTFKVSRNIPSEWSILIYTWVPSTLQTNGAYVARSIFIQHCPAFMLSISFASVTVHLSIKVNEWLRWSISGKANDKGCCF